MNSNEVRVYLDSDTDRAVPLVVAAVRSTDWNGWTVPYVTAERFRTWIAALAINDPDALWDASLVREEDGRLRYADDDMPDSWAEAGCSADDNGTQLYAIDGWCLITDSTYSTEGC